MFVKTRIRNRILIIHICLIESTYRNKWTGKNYIPIATLLWEDKIFGYHAQQLYNLSGAQITQSENSVIKCFPSVRFILDHPKVCSNTIGRWYFQLHGVSWLLMVSKNISVLWREQPIIKLIRQLFNVSICSTYCL